MPGKNGNLTCKRAKQLLPDYVAGLLDEVLHQAVQNHLLSCPECRREACKERIIFDNFAYYLATRTPCSLSNVSKQKLYT